MTELLWTEALLDALRARHIRLSTFACIHGVLLSERCEECLNTYPGRIRELSQAEADRLYRVGHETLGETI